MLIYYKKKYYKRKRPSVVTIARPRADLRFYFGLPILCILCQVVNLAIQSIILGEDSNCDQIDFTWVHLINLVFYRSHPRFYKFSWDNEPIKQLKGLRD